MWVRAARRPWTIPTTPRRLRLHCLMEVLNGAFFFAAAVWERRWRSGQKYTFGVVKAAQARGDFQVLAERDRRALRVHLGGDVAAGLAILHAAIEDALA